jgi:hypothetical protein
VVNVSSRANDYAFALDGHGELLFVCVAARLAVPASRLLTQTNEPIACDATGERKEGSNFGDLQESSLREKNVDLLGSGNIIDDRLGRCPRICGR